MFTLALFLAAFAHGSVLGSGAPVSRQALIPPPGFSYSSVTPEGPWNSLYTDIRDRNLQGIRATLLSQRDLNVRPGEGYATPLQYAAHLGHGEVVDLLMGTGLLFEVRPTDDRLVSIAAQAGHTVLAKKLLARGYPAKVNTLAALDEAELLRERIEEDPHCVQQGGLHKGRTPLHWAVCSGGTAAVKVLLEAGADVHVRSPSWSSGVSTGNPLEVLEVWERGLAFPRVFKYMNYPGLPPNPGLSSSHGDTPLHDAARVGNLESLRLLIQAGAELNAPSEYGRTPLTLAARGGYRDIVTVLLEAGADPNGYSPPELSLFTPDHLRRPGRPLDGALQWTTSTDSEFRPRRGSDSHPERIQVSLRLVEDLLAAGANPQLDALCALGRIDDVQSLLKADPSSLPSESEPLSWAARAGQVEVGRLLLMYGAGSAPPWHHDSPLSAFYFAAGAGQFEFAGMLLEEGMDPNTGRLPQSAVSTPARGSFNPPRAPILAAACNGSIPILELLVVNGLLWDSNSPKHRLAFHQAIRSAPLETIEWFLSRGSSPDAPWDDNFRPLHVAGQAGRLDVVELLLDRGACARARNVNGHTPDQAAADWLRPIRFSLSEERRAERERAITLLESARLDQEEDASK